MKICSTCKINPARNQKRGGYCRSCNNAYGKKNYQENKARYFNQAKKRDDQIDDLVNEFKNKPCADCGVSYPHYVMDLDHRVPSEKVSNLAYIRRRRWAFDRIRTELEKCDPVCSNCHRKRTNKQFPSRYSKRQNAP